MKLEKKKLLAAKALGVGANRIVFNEQRLNEIKEAITKQDIIDLHKDKAILIRPSSGRKTIQKRNTRRKHGSVKKKVKNKKGDYIIMVRKLRRYLKELKLQEKMSNEDFHQIRKEVRSRNFKSKSQLKERIKSL